MHSPLLTKLDFSDTRVGVFPTGMMQGLGGVTRLLASPHLQRIEPWALLNGTSLDEIDLRGSSLAVLETGSLAGPADLTELHFPANLSAVRAGALPVAPNLETLDLGVTSIEVLESGSLSQLTGVCRPGSSSSCFTLPSTLREIQSMSMPNVTSNELGDLDLSHTRLEDVPEGAFDGLARI